MVLYVEWSCHIHELPSNHLDDAITVFLFSLVVTSIFFLFLIRVFILLLVYLKVVSDILMI